MQNYITTKVENGVLIVACDYNSLLIFLKSYR
jgi:hypothetical protein